MFGHSSGAQQPLLHGGTHHSPYGGFGHHNHHHHNSHHHHHNAHHHHQPHQQQHHHPHHHPHHIPHHDFHHGYGRRWYRPWVSLNFRPAPIVQPPPLPHTHADIVVVEPSPFRFLRAIIYTIIIWILLGALYSGLTTNWVWGYQAQLGLPRKSDIDVVNDTNLDYPVPLGVNLTLCASPLEDSGEGDATFEIPSSSDAILLFSDGPWIYGSVEITTTSAETDSVKFAVSLSTRRGLPSDIIVCSLKRGDGEAGVGIFTPREEKRDPDDPIRYDVTVELPENHPVIKCFESHVINARHEIDDLQGKILFEALSLHGANGGIHSTSISTLWADISTVNGPINGYFNASDFLKIQTVNGRVEVDVDFNQDTSEKAVLSLLTSNGPLKADLRLHDAATSRSAPANFDVTARTANSPLNIAFLDAPVDSILTLEASTAVSPAEVTLHPTFEGHFSLSSTLFGVGVNKRPAVEDPSGKGRRRFVNYRNVRGHIDGDVAWGEGPHENRGKVGITSSLSRVTLNL